MNKGGDVLRPRVAEVRGKFTNIFFLTKFLKGASMIVLAVLVLVVLFTLSTWFFPQWYCSDCRAYPSQCSKEYQAALDTGNAAFCDNVKTAVLDWDYDNYCKEHCIGALAVKNKNVQGCERIARVKNESQVLPSIRDRCFMDLAKSLNDASLCERAETVWAQKKCAELNNKV